MADAVENLMDAAASGDIEGVRSALAAGADINSRRQFGDAALNLAAENGHGAVVRTLVGGGANIENLGGADKTPIMSAAFAGHVDVVRILLAAGRRISDDLLRSLSTKVGILQENAEDGMVRPEAAQAWREFLDSMIAERQLQDRGEKR